MLLSIAVISVPTWFDDDRLAGIAIAGAFVALPLTDVFGWDKPAELVPTYLALAAVAKLAVIERRKWLGKEGLPLTGVWGLYGLFRVIAESLDPTPEDLAYTVPFVFILLRASWVRPGTRVENATADNGIFMVLNAPAFFSLGCWDISDLPSEWLAPGMLALSLFALYLVAGVAAVKRCSTDAGFGPLLIGLAVLFLTFAPPLTFHGCPITVA